jgi:peptidoglycan/xylan/chitin deacetylase (PgdA/CDA1 family)
MAGRVAPRRAAAKQQEVDRTDIRPVRAARQGRIVDYLRQNKVRATFFAGGKWMLTHSNRVQQLLADPLFEVGNHTWGHRNLRLLSGRSLQDEILNPELAYEEVREKLRNSCPLPKQSAAAGKPLPARMQLFRFPFGACNTEALRAVGDAGFIAVQWDVSSGDPAPRLELDPLVRQVVDRVTPGSIVLFHANGRGKKTTEAIPLIVQQLRAQGYDFATVSELLETPGAVPEFKPTCYDVKDGDTNHYDRLARHLDNIYKRFIPPSALPSTAPAVSPAPQPAHKPLPSLSP